MTFVNTERVTIFLFTAQTSVKLLQICYNCHLMLLACVELLERLELLYECLVLVLQDGDAVLQALDVLLLLPPALAGGLSAWRRERTKI